MVLYFIPLKEKDLEFIKNILEEKEHIKFQIRECYNGQSMWITPMEDSSTEIYLKSYIKDTFVISRIF